MPDSIGALAATLSGGFFAGILIGYALKKVVKLIAVVVGLFLAGLAYLQYRQIVVISWNKIQDCRKMLLAHLRMLLLRFLVLAAITPQL
jgi:uncharacterized membrane protein (Fun14 family)